MRFEKAEGHGRWFVFSVRISHFDFRHLFGLYCVYSSLRLRGPRLCISLHTSVFSHFVHGFVESLSEFVTFAAMRRGSPLGVSELMSPAGRPRRPDPGGVCVSK